MKFIRKITSFILCVCAVMLLLPLNIQAAEPQIRFSDPSTTQGATFDVDVTFYADEEIGDVDAELSYDSSALRFVSGDGATGDNGQIQLTGTGDGSTEMHWTLQFQALEVTTTTIQVQSVTASSVDGNDFQVTRGSSNISIGEGDPSLIQDSSDTSGTSSDVQVEIDGATYTVTDFSDILIPTGFTKTELTFEGSQCPAAQQESSGKYAIYLTDANGEQDFFLYDPDDGSFAPFEQISISQDRFIIPLTKDTGTKMPDNLQETTFTVNGKEFPAWQNVDDERFYVLYALNSDGDEEFYQFDSTDDTYQRYPIENVDQDSDQGSSSFLGRLMDTLRDNMDKFLVGTWLIFLFLLIIVIILAVKLRHRNLELDDLYDEYGIDLEEEPEEVPEKKKKKDKKNKKGKKPGVNNDDEPELDDDFGDYDDDGFDDGLDDGYDDEYDIDDDDYAEDDYDDDDYEEEDYEEDYDSFVNNAKESYSDATRHGRLTDEEEDDDVDALRNARVREPEKRPKKKPERRSHAEDDDTFKMDIIDLD